jgi:hypothetical protein
LGIRPRVKLTDANNNAVAGATITFAVASGGGNATGLAKQTDAAGLAEVDTWTLGPNPGPNSLSATAPGTGITGNPATFSATGTALAPTDIVKHEGDNQVAIAGQAVGLAPAVRVTSNGTPLQGVSVDFTVTQGGGTVPAPPSQRAVSNRLLLVQVQTDANGVARAPGWTLGAVGANAMRAQAAGTNINGNPVTFTATGALNPANFQGNWTGSWNSTTFGTSGSVTMTATVNTVAKTATIQADFNGAVFGIGDPPSEGYNATYSPASGGFNTTSNRFGGLTMSVSPTGVVTGTCLNPAPGITRVDITGTLTATSLNTNYVVRFAGGGTAVGTWNMTKQ